MKVAIKIMFNAKSKIQDRVEVYTVSNKHEAVLKAVDNMTVEEIRYLFSFEYVEEENN